MGEHSSRQAGAGSANPGLWPPRRRRLSPWTPVPSFYPGNGTQYLSSALPLTTAAALLYFETGSHQHAQVGSSCLASQEVKMTGEGASHHPAPRLPVPPFWEVTTMLMALTYEVLSPLTMAGDLGNSGAQS